MVHGTRLAKLESLDLFITLVADELNQEESNGLQLAFNCLQCLQKLDLSDLSDRIKFETRITRQTNLHYLALEDDSMASCYFKAQQLESIRDLIITNSDEPHGITLFQ